MSVRVATINEARTSVARSLEINTELKNVEDLSLISQALRRAVVFLAPCSSATLVQAVTDSLRGLLHHESSDLKVLVRDVLSQLCSVSDILELAPPDSNHHDSQRFLWSAPPSFVTTFHNRIYLLGSKGDSITHIPDDLRRKVQYSEGVRFLASNTGVIENELIEYGLHRITPKDWVRRPADATPEDFLKSPLAKLARQRDSVQDISLLSGHGQYYKSRWQTPSPNCTGRFVARRPQRFGADRWCLAQAVSGEITHLCDVVGTHNRERPCDRGWMLQYALAAKSGSPERYRIDHTDRVCRLSLFFPLPNWAEKLILLSADRVEAKNALICFEISGSAKGQIIELLERGLWMAELES